MNTHDWIYRFEPGRDRSVAPLLLLHGTGGNEHDLVPLGRALAADRALLSPRGRVLEHGQPRFFRRFAEGRLDEADVRARADELAAFLDAQRREHDLAPPIAVGFSNGANIATALLLARPGALGGALLLRAMLPLGDVQPEERAAALAGVPVLMLSGSDDPIAPVAGAEALAGRLTRAGAVVDHRVVPAQHGLTALDLSLGKAWLAGQPAASMPPGLRGAA